jgi:hypothetical protein
VYPFKGWKRNDQECRSFHQSQSCRDKAKIREVHHQPSQTMISRSSKSHLLSILLSSSPYKNTPLISRCVLLLLHNFVQPSPRLFQSLVCIYTISNWLFVLLRCCYWLLSPCRFSMRVGCETCMHVGCSNRARLMSLIPCYRCQLGA